MPLSIRLLVLGALFACTENNRAPVIQFAPPCVDADGLEPNDSLGAAAAVGLGPITGLHSCTGTDDYYSYSVLAGETLEFVVGFRPEDGNLDAELLDGAGSVLQTLDTTTNHEVARYTSPTDQTLTLRVFAENDATGDGVPYNLTVGSHCGDADVYEENNGLGTATPYPGGTLRGVQLCGTTIDDYFRVDARRGESLEFDINFSHAGANIDTWLMHEDGTVLARSESLTSGEEMRWTVEEAQPLYWRIFMTSDGGPPGISYSMFARTTCFDDDAFESNDTREDAGQLSLGTTRGLELCSTSWDDWYAFDIRGGETMTLGATFAHASGNVDLELYDEAGNEVAASRSEASGESIQYTAGEDGAVYLRAYMESDDASPGVPYSLSLASNCFDDDVYEPNNTLETAYAHGLGMLTGNELCGAGAHDWFSVPVRRGETLEISSTFASLDGNIDLELYDASGTLLDSSTTDTANESIIHSSAEDAVVYVRVFMAEDAGSVGAPYSLSVGSLCFDDDAAEANDDIASAFPVEDGVTRGMELCSDVLDDYYAISLLAGEVVNIGINVSQILDANLDLQLFDADGELLAESASPDTDDGFQWAVSEDTTVYLRVYMTEDIGAVGAPYSVSVGLTCYDDDNVEVNDTIEQAALMPVGSNTWRKLCLPGFDDYYAVDMLAGQNIEFSATFSAMNGDVDLRLLDADGLLIDESTTTGTDGEAIFYQSATDQRVYVHAYLVGDDEDVGISYSFRVWERCLDDDEFEPNDSAAAAAAINGEHLGLEHCGLVDDWYALVAREGEIFDLDLQYEDAYGTLAYRLVDGVGSDVPVDPPLGGRQHVQYVSPVAQTLQLEVSSAGDVRAAGLNYRLRAESICYDGDDSEPNNALGEATLVGIGRLADRELCGTADDWFRIDLRRGESMEIGIDHLHDEGNNDIELYDADGTLIDTSTSMSDNERISIVADEPMSVFLRVFVAEDALVGADYDVVVDSLCFDGDVAEVNNALGSGGSVEDATGVSLHLCSNADDYYRLDVWPPERVTVTAHHAAADALSLRLLDAEGEERLVAEDNGDHATLSYAPTEPETLWVHASLVTDANGGGLPYSFELDRVCEDLDGYADNTSIEDAAPLGEGLFEGLSSCDDDVDDHFEIDLNPNEEITIRIDGGGGGGGGGGGLGGIGGATLIGAGGVVVAVAVLVAPGVFVIVWVAPVAGPVVLVVDTVDVDGGPGVSYEIDVSIECSDSVDLDGDGTPELCDNCPGVPGPQLDSDLDGFGDVCDRCALGNDGFDLDNDLVPDACDQCQGFNDALDLDDDGVIDGCDSCPAVPNVDQLDSDDDGVGDLCDLCPGEPDAADADGDLVPDGCDVCGAGDDGIDVDEDDVPDACDRCLLGDDAIDVDVDGVPDACDTCLVGDDGEDDDGDGVPNACDSCPAGPDTVDADGDSIADACDRCALGDDRIDGDGDGVPDACDICLLGDDAIDSDGDSIPDGCDRCSLGDDALDADDDAVPDACDVCAGFDDALDDDGDGVPNGCDVCLAGDDALDDDGDSVADACDVCAGFDDALDDDSDGVPDGCDRCALGDDRDDDDNDAVPDACDVCDGFDDTLDDDGDQVPNGCDQCLAGDDALDGDNDSVSDACDVCDGFDDAVDDDGDGVPDGCDQCPAGDDALDEDIDSVPDACDICDGFDDALDDDGDQVPNGCDQCLAGDDALDADNDAVADACDVCDGFDDALDDDGDGVPNGCDQCPTGDDGLDDDGDLVPDSCDQCPAGDDALDDDGDTVADACDVCDGFDDALDDDGDQVPNGCDQCLAGDDALDDDSDAVADACDVCPGFDDALDDDGDLVPNGCDQCPAGDDALDDDGDAVADACDACPGFDDALDDDGDSVPNGCDICAAGDDTLDSDIDGVPDACDACPGFDDTEDLDGDGLPDGCEECLGDSGDTGFNLDSDGDGVADPCDPCPLDASDDSDLDGVCDGVDLCPGFDDAIDSDGDGIPNGCDTCAEGSDVDDRDGDGTPDACDPCPDDPQDDQDGDGICDSQDLCPAGDDSADRDGDGLADACDPCPGLANVEPDDAGDCLPDVMTGDPPERECGCGTTGSAPWLWPVLLLVARRRERRMSRRVPAWFASHPRR